MICECSLLGQLHTQSDHDSGGCCKIRWCNCSHFRPIEKPEANSVVIPDQPTGSMISNDAMVSDVKIVAHAAPVVETGTEDDLLPDSVVSAIQHMIPIRPMHKSVKREPFKCINVLTADYSVLAAWAYLAIDHIKKLEAELDA